VSDAPAGQRIAVGVVLERRTAKSPWTDFVWRPTAALPGRPETAPWTEIGGDAEHTNFYAGAVEIVLYPSDTAYYRDNLASGSPSLWVVLRPTGAEPPFEIVAVTANPHEGESHTAADSALVDFVPMPEVVRETIAAFVAANPADDTFYKRTRTESDPEALARRAPGSKR